MRAACVGLLFASFGAAGAEESDVAAKGGPMIENRLAGARSPYLRQHRTNPVDWFPWGDEAFAKAKAEDRPVFLSVGYAACHWCHVMEHESFEDVETARQLNETFVCVKVDREERPDVDRLYMQAVQLFGRGGWPMTVLLLPDGRPFLGATYLQREGLGALCVEVKRLWATRRTALVQQAEAIGERMANTAAGSALPPAQGSDDDLLRMAGQAVAARFDSLHAGYGDAASGWRPKFPPHTELLLALEEPERQGADLVDQARLTLLAMEQGGIHDHVGGGFHRYSTDRAWLLPHFEKMLYDNALLLRAYGVAAGRLGSAPLRRAAERCVAFLERDLLQPGGGYASSLDADTEGEEGLTYTWTMKELEEHLQPAALQALVEVSRASVAGNFHDEATGRATGRNILHVARPFDQAATALGVDVPTAEARYHAALDALLAPRKLRPQPRLDEKVVVGWNGLLVSAFVRAGQALERPEWTQRGLELARFLLERCRREDGVLLRFPRDEGPEIVGFCEDYVHVIEGLLDAAEATGDASWREAARALGLDLLRGFEDRKQGGFFTASTLWHESLVLATKETWDSPIPSDNGTAARVCLRLHAATRHAPFRAAADRTLDAWRPMMAFAGMAPGLVALYRALGDRRRLDVAAAGLEEPPDAETRGTSFVARAFLERGEALAGTHVSLVVRLDLAAGWHVGADPEREAESALSLDIEGPGGWTLGPIEGLPLPDSAAGTGALQIGATTLVLRTSIAIVEGAPRGPRLVPLRLSIQLCDDVGTCLLPQHVELDLKLRVADEAGPRKHPHLFGK